MDKQKLRDEFFKKHVSRKTSDGIPIVSTHPHNLFEWFYEQLTIPVVGVTLPIKEKIEFKYCKDDNKYIHRLTFDNINGEAKIIDSEFIRIIND